METEAKFIVPDEETYRRLQQATSVGRYAVRDARVKRVHDLYLDTPGHRFYHGGLYARLRRPREGGPFLVTLKQVGKQAEGAIFTREEYETEATGSDMASWPEGEVRRIAEEVAGGEPLADLFTIDQARIVAHLYDDTRAVAEMSLDDVTIETSGEPARLFEIEVELLPDGTLEDLKAIAETLSTEYALAPQPLSKFERAMLLTSTAQREGGGPASGGESEGESGPHAPEVAVVPAEAVTAMESSEAPAITSEEAISPAPVGAEEAPTAPAIAAEEGASEAKDRGKGRKKGKAAGKLEAQGQAQQEEQVGAAELDAAVGQGTAAEPPARPARASKQIGVERADSMLTAGRKIVRAYFQDMLDNESGTRLGEDPEALHDMRVATRRMRAALRVLGPYLHSDASTRAARGLRTLTRSLGTVRDLDVLSGNARKFRETLPAEQQADLDGLLALWDSKREEARKELLKHLRSKEYERFKARVNDFVSDEKDDTPADESQGAEPYQVRHVAGSAIWLRYEAVRAFETLMDAPTIEQLHALRISAKYLRYTLECFRETLPATAPDLIADVVAVQDQLGALHDADVASGLIRAFIRDHHKRELQRLIEAPEGEVEPVPPPPGLVAYLTEREVTTRNIYAEFFSTWARVGGAKWRGKLAQAVAGL